MKYLVICFILIGFIGTAYAQYEKNEDGKLMWPLICHANSEAECDPTALFHSAISKPFAESDSVAVGTIIQKNIVDDEDSITYSIDVDFYLKNSQPFDLITATLNDIVVAPPQFPDVLYYNSPVFNEGDLAFVYLQKNNGQYDLLSYSFALDKQEGRGPPPDILLTKNPYEKFFKHGDEIFFSGDVRKMELVKAAINKEPLAVKLSIFEDNDTEDDDQKVIFSSLLEIDVEGTYHHSLSTSEILPGTYDLEVNYGPSTSMNRITIEPDLKNWSPLKQFKLGISLSDIQCLSGLELIVKHSTNTPACVKSETKVRLFERGWSTEATIFGESSRQCFLEPEIGPCKVAIEKFYFDSELNSCQSFTWGGCNGIVPFDTKTKCEKLCK